MSDRFQIETARNQLEALGYHVTSDYLIKPNKYVATVTSLENTAQQDFVADTLEEAYRQALWAVSGGEQPYSKQYTEETEEDTEEDWLTDNGYYYRYYYLFSKVDEVFVRLHVWGKHIRESCPLRFTRKTNYDCLAAAKEYLLNSPFHKGFDSLVDDPNAERVTNDAGGKQSRLDYDLTLIDPIFLQELAKVMTENCKEYGGHYERDNWKKIDAHDHLMHLYNHVSLIMEAVNEVSLEEGYTHAIHAACRVMMLIRKWKEQHGTVR